MCHTRHAKSLTLFFSPSGEGRFEREGGVSPSTTNMSIGHPVLELYRIAVGSPNKLCRMEMVMLSLLVRSLEKELEEKMSILFRFHECMLKSVEIGTSALSLNGTYRVGSKKTSQLSLIEMKEDSQKEALSFHSMIILDVQGIKLAWGFRLPWVPTPSVVLWIGFRSQ